MFANMRHFFARTYIRCKHTRHISIQNRCLSASSATKPSIIYIGTNRYKMSFQISNIAKNAIKSSKDCTYVRIHKRKATNRAIIHLDVFVKE